MGEGRGREDVLLGPFDIEDEMVVAKARHPCNGAGSIFPTVKADKSKTLGARGRELWEEDKKWVPGPLLSSHPFPRQVHPP